MANKKMMASEKFQPKNDLNELIKRFFLLKKLENRNKHKNVLLNNLYIMWICYTMYTIQVFLSCRLNPILGLKKQHKKKISNV